MENRIEGRPYRSHMQPACVPCRARKSRCKTTTSTDCLMCQAHGTECIFPRGTDRPRKKASHSRRSAPSKGRSITASPVLTERALRSNTSTTIHESEGLSGLVSNSVVEFNTDDTEEGSSHVVSPAIADDDRVFNAYLSNTPYGQSGRMVRFHLSSDRPIVFNTLPKRGLRELESRALAASNCAIIEKTIEPYQDELINLFFKKINICFPIFDELSFRRLLATQKEKISSGLLAHFYGNTMIHWDASPILRNVKCPDHYSIWVQAENALTAELSTTPGISTIITIILNLSGRPSTHILSNGGLLGMAVAHANAFGLNRDPSNWNLSPTEKKFRIRIWRILVVYDRWCSLAYGTPPLIHRTQHDVPALAAEDLHNPGASREQIDAAACFVALTTLTEVLGHCLEHVYHLDKGFSSKPEAFSFGLETLLITWEDSLSDHLRRLVIRGTGNFGAGAANLRLAYLSVKLLIRRSQLDLDKVSLQIEDTESLYYIQARRVCEEIVDFVRELDETQCRDFWIPLNAYSLTSATTFLMRTALTSRGQPRNPSLKLARDMINALRSHRRNYAWDLADSCLSNCSVLVEKIESACEESSSNNMEFQEPMLMYMDIAALNGMFSEYGGSF